MEISLHCFRNVVPIPPTAIDDAVLAEDSEALKAESSAIVANF
jgi:hypothetical protein